jgi:hypothetical protein
MLREALIQLGPAVYVAGTAAGVLHLGTVALLSRSALIGGRGLMRYLSICVVLAALVAAPNALSAKGGHPLHLFPEQAAGVSLPGDFLGGCGHGRYHDGTGNCSGPADVRDQVP